MKILAISDEEMGILYSPHITRRFQEVDLVISCGDLSYSYLEYILSMLDVPLLYVRGNHAGQVEWTAQGERLSPWGAVDLHQRILRMESGLLIAGFEGCLQYNYGRNQYSQSDYWSMVLGMVPGLLYNKLRYGRYLDILVTHAPPWKIQDREDRPHQGIRAFRWLINVFKPQYHFHGHIHLYRQDEVAETQHGPTRVVNAYGFREINLEGFPAPPKPIRRFHSPPRE